MDSIILNWTKTLGFKITLVSKIWDKKHEIHDNSSISKLSEGIKVCI